ncbi:unnamed protein product, partial [Didymodactylos carnosus]
VNLFVTNFESQVPSTFKRTLQLIRQTTYANQLQTTSDTKYSFKNRSNNRIGVRSIISQYSSSNCSCVNNAMKCFDETGIRDEDELLLFTVPNFYRGCYVTEGLYASTLDCFYSKTCLEKLQSYMPVSTNFTSLNSSSTSRYLSNTTLGTIIDTLMIETWHDNISYQSYYNSCQPQYCRYTFIRRKDYIFLSKTLMSVFGGLFKWFKISTSLL